MKKQKIIKFTKMHGLGNDYIYINCFEEQGLQDYPALAIKMSERHTGIGGDGLVLIMASNKADFKMRIFNLDGSEAEMCGNATRCIGKYVYERKLTNKTTITLETLGGIKVLDLTVKDGKVASVRVDMGEPILETAKIPMSIDKENFISQPVAVGSEYMLMTAVSVGNPHCVTFLDMLDDAIIHGVGPTVECHELFPKKTNAEFVRVIDKNSIEMRVWERGSGETQACGTAASACIVACVLNGVTNRKITVKMLGGDLELEWSKKDNHVYLTGPAEIVFDGEYYL